MNLIKIYKTLLRKHGHHSWWPVSNPNATKEEKQFEIILGAILTQNTSWKNAEKALKKLIDADAASPEKIISLGKETIAGLIRSSGYYNQKTERLILMSSFLLGLQGEPTREQLLEIKGIGKETADSILLYAYGKPVFVIDAYTKRLFSQDYGLSFKDYDGWQDFFHKNLPKDAGLFNEFHALIVEEGKLRKA